MTDKITEITEFATEIIIKELKRRRSAGQLNDSQLTELAGEQWTAAEDKAGELGELGHE